MSNSKPVLDPILNTFSGVKCLLLLAGNLTFTTLKYLLRLHDGRQSFGDMLFRATIVTILSQRLPVVRFYIYILARLIDKLMGVKPSQWVRPVNGNGFKGYFVQDQSERGDPEIVILFMHGGGFAFGDALMFMSAYIKWVEKIKQVTGKRAALLSIEYSLSPEAKYPTQFNECVAAYKYLLEEKGFPAKRIIIGGDSAGGNLAISLGVKFAEDIIEEIPGCLPSPAGLLLISPWCNMAHVAASFHRNAKYDIVRRSGVNRWREYYLGNRVHHVDPRVSPLQVNLFRGLPPCFVTLGSVECFYDDIKVLIDRLKTDGVTVEVWEEPRLHEFPLLPDTGSLSPLTTINRGAEKLARFIKEHVLV
ncbi:uncharacterized protein VTP21DRAFT_10032 [Calcarisporiella thermophila]|uniref:uncharacterized protein n=1 Tax=Calcarisporiella thermophila TaxID=911321 RepID=UPI003743997F